MRVNSTAWGRLGVIISDSLEKVKDEFDLIDFTRPEVPRRTSRLALAHGKQMVIGTTTALTRQAKAALHEAGKQIGIVFASNYSVGVNLVFKLLSRRRG